MWIRGYGLFWSEWRRTRKGLCLVIITQLACLVFVAARPDASYWPLFAIGFVPLLFMAHLLGRERMLVSEALSIPRWAFRLPAGASEIVFWLLLYRLAALFPLTVLSAIPFHSGVAIGRNSLFMYPILLPVFLVIQIAAWILPAAGVRPRLALLAIAYAFGVFVLLSYFRDGVVHSLPGNAAFTLGSTVVAFSIAVYAAFTLRSNGTSRGWYTLFRFSPYWTGRGQGHVFSTRTQALTWFTRQGVVGRLTVFLSFAIILSAAIINVGSLFEGIEDAVHYRETVWTAGLFMVITMAGIVGTVSLALEQGYSRRGHGFLVRQPVPESAIALGKFVFATQAILLWGCILVAAYGALALFLLWWSFGAVLNPLPPHPIWAFAPLLLVASWVSYWQVYVLFSSWMAVNSVGYIASALAPEVARGFWAAPGREVPATACLGALVMLIVFAFAHRRGVIGLPTIAASFAVCLLLSVLGVFSIRACGYLDTWDIGKLTVFCAAVSVLAVGPFASVPAYIHVLRHR
ncbi:MAG: hypothetical protein AMXMBFR84_27020 [Candidatus Hydrogenedentota bacterium]